MSDGSSISFDKYLIGVVVRVAVMLPIVVIGFALLYGLELVNQEKNGVPILAVELELVRLIFLGAIVVVPILLGILMAECFTWLIHAVTKSTSGVVVGIPILMGILGLLLATAVFVDPQANDRVADRLFALGGMLLFFLAGSLQVWAWQQWTGRLTIVTPMAWYASAMLITAAFLGSMIAWQAPSPYVREVQRYYRDRWQGRPDPVLPAPSASPDLSI